jgi:hypothetical protein
MPTGFELIWGLGIVFSEGEEEIDYILVDFFFCE